MKSELENGGLQCRDTNSYIEYKAEKTLLQAAIWNRKQGTTSRFCGEDLPQTCKSRDDLTLCGLDALHHSSEKEDVFTKSYGIT